MRFTVIENFVPSAVIAAINEEINGLPDSAWFKKAASTSAKWSTNQITTIAKKVIDIVEPALIEEYTGIKGLLADPSLFGAGFHLIQRGGFLNMHRDFNVHPTYGWHRRVNVLIYLNEDWKEEWGGQLQLGCDNPIMIDPIAGRCVIFETTEDSWHGHPEPLKCPADRQRRSLALYFYTKEPPPTAPHSTIYR